MDIKIIEKALRDYRRKKSVIETTLARIENYKQTINNPDDFISIYLSSQVEPGMPRGPKGKTSPVVRAITDKEDAIEELRQWIKDDKSRIYPYQIEKEQIDAAMGALNMQEKFIIECKYFENMFWRDIEINFNNRFRQQNYITVSGIRKMNSEAIELLSNILEPYYKRFKITK